MSFKNAVKIIIAKFSLVWNVLLYSGGVFVFLFLIMYGMWYPAFEAMNDAGYITAIVNAMTSFFNGHIYFMEVITIIGATLGEIGTTFLQYPASIVLTPIVILLIGRILIGLKDLAVCVCLDAYMCANRKIGFCEAYFSNFRRSIKLVLSRTLFTLPFDVITMLLMWGTSRLLDFCGITYLMPFFLIIEWILMLAFKHLMFSLWPAYIATEENHTFSGMRRSIKLSFVNSRKFYSNWVITGVIALALNAIIAVFTLGAGLLITLPLTLVFEQVLSMTMLFNKTKRRYYLDNGEVFVSEGAPSIDKAEVEYLSVVPSAPLESALRSETDLPCKTTEDAAVQTETAKVKATKPRAKTSNK